MVPFLYSVSQAEVENQIDRVLDGLDRNLTVSVIPCLTFPIAESIDVPMER
jgi:hypothetical protein